jgi:hypothetical protein
MRLAGSVTRCSESSRVCGRHVGAPTVLSMRSTTIMPPWSFCGSTIALTFTAAVNASTAGKAPCPNLGQTAGSQRLVAPIRRGVLFQVPPPTPVVSCSNAGIGTDGGSWQVSGVEPACIRRHCYRASEPHGPPLLDASSDMGCWPFGGSTTTPPRRPRSTWLCVPARGQPGLSSAAASSSGRHVNIFLGWAADAVEELVGRPGTADSSSSSGQ